MEKEKEMAKKYYWLKLKDNFFNQKEKRITFRVTSDEFKVLKEKAEDKNLTVSDLIRTVLADNLK